MIFDPIIKLGCHDLPFSAANKVQFTNIVALLTFFISVCYTLNYLFVLQNTLVASINLGFTLAYGLTWIFNYYNAHKMAKFWFFTVLMVHLIICTNLYVTNASGFHLYYFLVPTGAFLLFELDETKEKFTLSILAIICYFYCENTFNASPLIELTTRENYIMYQSVVFFNMLEVIFVMTLFTSQIEEHELQLTQQATTDALTGIYNRHYFFSHGNEMLNESKYHQRPFAIILIDIDHFKEVNDNYGHFDGDICLKEVSQLINNRCRHEDLFSRIGGEEFVIALKDTNKNEALILAEQIRSTLEKHVINLSNNQTITCTASFGISSLSDENEPLKALLVNADKALYEAKTNGRNRSAIYTV